MLLGKQGYRKPSPLLIHLIVCPLVRMLTPILFLSIKEAGELLRREILAQAFQAHRRWLIQVNPPARMLHWGLTPCVTWAPDSQQILEMQIPLLRQIINAPNTYITSIVWSPFLAQIHCQDAFRGAYLILLTCLFMHREEDCWGSLEWVVILLLLPVDRKSD